MTTEELQKIVEYAKLSLIEKKLRENGFINAKLVPTLWDTSLVDIAHAESSIAIDDVCKGNLLFRATICENVKNKKGYTWIWLEMLKAQKESRQRRKERRTEPFLETTDDAPTYFPHKIIIYAKQKENSNNEQQ